MKHLLTTTAAPIPRDPCGYSMKATPAQFRSLGHSWADIERWTMTGKVEWEPGEREKYEGDLK